MTLGSFSNPLLPIKFFFNGLKNHEKEKHAKVILLCLHCSSYLE